MQVDLVATQAALNTVGETVCNQPVCAAGTQAVNGTCVPDCSDLRRRGVQCEPFCDAADVVTPGSGSDGGNVSSSSSSSSPLVPTWLVVVIVLGVALAFAAAGVAVQRARHSCRHEKHETSQQQHTMTMFMNPLHAGFASSTVAEDHINADFQESTRDVKLDSDLYVQPPSDATNEAAYSLFRASAVGRGAQATDASTYSLFQSPDATA
jgi:hypothetical protein